MGAGVFFSMGLFGWSGGWGSFDTFLFVPSLFSTDLFVRWSDGVGGCCDWILRRYERSVPVGMYECVLVVCCRARGEYILILRICFVSSAL